MATLTLVLIFLLGIIIGGTIIYTFMKSKMVSRNRYEDLDRLYTKACYDVESYEKDQAKQEINIQNLSQENDSIKRELYKIKADYENLNTKHKEQKEETSQLQDLFIKEFENLANKILEENSNKLTKQNKENIGDILNPLQKQILNFEKKVEDSQKENIGIHVSLKEELKHLNDGRIDLSIKTENLIKALKSDTKTQGNWGELILERVLEKSGLRKGQEYFVQQSFENPNDKTKKVRPDVIINLSGNNHMIIDSKVSLTHYERFINEEDPNKKENHIKEHINSIKKHIDELSKKKYEEIETKSLDFVLLFIPNDPAFAYALNHDHTLWEKAFEKNIVIVTPITILATLKTIDSLWTIQRREENAEKIAKLAGTLYDKFLGFYDNLKNIDVELNKIHKEFKEARNRLVTGHGSATITIEKLKKLGAKSQKSLPKELAEKIEYLESLETTKVIEHKE